MYLSPHSLHAPIVVSHKHKAEIKAKLASVAKERALRAESLAAVTAPTAPSFEIPLTTVSMNGGFDAYMVISFEGQAAGASTQVLVDSGNSMLIVPSWEDIAALPDSSQNYTVLASNVSEPWGSPANVVRGPVQIPTASGEIYTLDDCVFYACTGAPRTANFGAGCISPWSASGWDVPPGAGVTMQSPLSYNSSYPYAEFNYAPAATMFAADASLTVSTGSSLVMYQAQPGGYSMFGIIPNLEWMSLIPMSLAIGGAQTQWPGDVASPIAMVDTGGGPVFLSDPNGYVYSGSWPGGVTCPTWTSGSDSCQCISDDITIELGDATSSTSYTIDTSTLPPSVQGLTLVMCKVNEYMRGRQGMNIGGISALFNYILVDYAGARVGLKPKP